MSDQNRNHCYLAKFVHTNMECIQKERKKEIGNIYKYANIHKKNTSCRKSLETIQNAANYKWAAMININRLNTVQPG